MYMYTLRHKTLRAFFKMMLFASSVVLFGNRLTDRFNICASVTGGLSRMMHKQHHPYPAHREFGDRYGKVLSSVDKRYHSPMSVGIGEPGFRILTVVTRAVHAGYVLPVSPPARFYSRTFLRGPPVCGVILS